MMKATFLKGINCTIFLFLVAVFLGACKKNKSDGNSFTWVHNSITQSTKLDTAYISQSGRLSYSIIAGENKPGYIIFVRVEFNLTSFNKGTYIVNDGSGAFNRLTYKDDAGNTLIGVNGILNITENADNYLSGNFSTTLISGSGVTSQLTGNFTNMPVR